MCAGWGRRGGGKFKYVAPVSASPYLSSRRRAVPNPYSMGTPFPLTKTGTITSPPSACPYTRMCFSSAHGRLGTGDNKCRHEPVRLKVWPPGFPGCVVKDIALGGAHSIVLAHRSVAPTTLANPWGAESLAYAWGYGYCGQLGLGQGVSFAWEGESGGCGQATDGMLWKRSLTESRCFL